MAKKSDGAGGVVDAELGGQFLGDLVLSPAGVIAGNAFDEGVVIPGNAGSADLARTRLTTPHGFEALAMPTDDGCGLHDDEGVGAAGPETVKSNPEHAILGTKSGALLSTKVDAKLLAQGSVFQSQVCRWHPGGPHESEWCR
jgi:hypothetical protein